MIRFLQISDIHFKDKNGNDDEYRQMKCRFLEDIATCQNTKGQIDYILICGDIAFSGLDNEYKIAKSFIDTICDNAKCKNVLLVPGNHDKKWVVYPRMRQAMRDYLLKGKNLKLLLESKVNEPMAIGVLYSPFKQYYKLAEEKLCISEVASMASVFPESEQKGKVPKFASRDKMYWTQNLGKIKGFNLYIHGSNTSLISDKDDGDSRKPLDGKHLQMLPLQCYNIEAKSDEIHILMLHHPMSEIYDEGNKIGKDIDSRFKLQLYGHVHKQSSAIDGAIKIYSGALQPEEDESEEYFPVYNVIELDVIESYRKPVLKVDVFSRKWNGAGFEDYKEETKTGVNALTIELEHNESWGKTVNASNNKMGVVFPETTINPYEVKTKFIHCGKERAIIKSMYGDSFDKITPNRTKYVAFLNRVDEDGRLNELNEILKNYDK